MTLYRFTQVLNRCRLPYGWTAGVVYEGNRYFLRVGDPNGTCNVSGDHLPWWGRKWRLSEHMTDGEVVQTAFLAMMAAVEHEAREGFTYRGVSVFDPHYDIEKLVELRKSPGGGLKERPYQPASVMDALVGPEVYQEAPHRELVLTHLNKLAKAVSEELWTTWEAFMETMMGAGRVSEVEHTPSDPSRSPFLEHE